MEETAAMTGNQAVEPQFPIHWVLPVRGGESACYKSKIHPGRGYAFRPQAKYRHTGGHQKTSIWYRCINCRKIYEEIHQKNKKGKKRPGFKMVETPRFPSIHISSDQFLEDPDKIFHACMERPTNDTLWYKLSARWVMLLHTKCRNVGMILLIF
jgi:hypothetical protein